MTRALRISLAALALALFIFPLAAQFALLDPDEGLHAAISQEMLERRDFITPRFLGEPFRDKPILFFWSQALSLALFGQHEAAARLPGLVFGALGAWTTGLLAGAVFGDRRVRWMAAAFYATMILPLAMSLVPVHDVALVPWTNLALLALWRAARAGAPRATIGHSLVAGVWLGLAILTKGFAGVAIVGLAHLALLIVERRLEPVVIAGGALAVLAGIAIASPWYLAMEHAQPGYLRYYLFERHVEGFATETQRHGHRPWFYYLGVIGAGGLPWILYVPFARSRSGDSRVETTGPAAAARLGWCWLLTGVVFLSVAGSKLFTYALPLFPAVAVLAAVTWTRWLRPTDPRAGLKPGPSISSPDERLADSRAGLKPGPSIPSRDARPTDPSMERPGFSPAGPAFRWTITLHGIVGAALVPAALLTAQFASPWRAGPWLWIASIPLAIAQLVAARRAVAGRLRAAAITAAWAHALVIVLALTFVLPPVAEWFSARDVALAINRHGRFPSELWMLHERPGSVVFYLAPELRRGLTPDRLRHVTSYELLRWDVPAGALVAVEQDDLERVRSFRPLAELPYERAGHFRLYDPNVFRARTPSR